MEDVRSKINDGAFTISTDFVIAVPSILLNDTYDLYDMYNPWKDGGGQINVTSLGSWSRTGKLSVTLTQSKFLRRANLHGINMRAAFFGVSIAGLYAKSEYSMNLWWMFYDTIILSHLTEQI